MKSPQAYLTTEQLADRIHYTARTIRNELLDSCLFEGRHYVRPFGRRKILFIWEAIEADMLGRANDPMALVYQLPEVSHHGWNFIEERFGQALFLFYLSG
jgi:hypothetical protein